ncbi:MAG: ABC transporter ATP-binding protein [Bdellovibrionaceae bacterium]|nr:ABC transporter ATP-binding protein [Pseudobdellovibrionaceae bacterium]
MAKEIEFKNFKKSFGQKAVHEDISFSVEKGECLGLLGGSGAGKSVILKSLIGLMKPDSGSIFLEGQDITLLNEDEMVEIRKQVAYVFQNGALFDSMTVFDNLAYPLREHTTLTESEIEKRVHDLLNEFNLATDDLLYPGELSGGMQKRVGMARSIILGPEVVLYDEPTAGLDPFNIRRIQEMILAMKAKGVTSIFVTHDMPSAFACCDRIALLRKGRIVHVESVEKLKQNDTGMINDFVNGMTA